MTAVLSIEQLQALQKSLIKNLVDEKPKTEQILSNEEYINRYITAKGLEGKTKGKKVYSDEELEVLREHCRDIRGLALYS